MFRIKICGITNNDDALSAADAGADAIGLNFYSKSRRFIEPERARHIAAALPAHVMKIGVFVNRSAQDIHAIANEVGLNGVQLHGEERPDLLAKLPNSVHIVRACRCGADGLAPVSPYLDECRRSGRSPDAMLIDSDAGPQFGGSGIAADWERIANERGALGRLPLILAGGLNAENVSAAIAAVRPDGVDVASGVEHQPGMKDRKLMADFIAAAREALAEI